MLRKFEGLPLVQRERQYIERLGKPVAFVRVPSLHTVDVAVPDPDRDGGFKRVRASATDYIVLGSTGAMSVWPADALGKVFNPGPAPLVPSPGNSGAALPEPLARLVSWLELRPKMDVSQAGLIRDSLEQARKDTGIFLRSLLSGLKGEIPGGIAVVQHPGSLVSLSGTHAGLSVLSPACRMGLIDLVGVSGLPPELPSLLKGVLGVSKAREVEAGKLADISMGYKVRESMALLGFSVTNPLFCGNGGFSIKPSSPAKPASRGFPGSAIPAGI